MGSYCDMQGLNTAEKKMITLSAVDILPASSILPVATQEQIQLQKMETYAFVHLELNAFNNLERGYGDTHASTFSPVEQLTTFSPLKGQKISLKAIVFSEGAKQISVWEFSLL